MKTSSEHGRGRTGRSFLSAKKNVFFWVALAVASDSCTFNEMDYHSWFGKEIASCILLEELHGWDVEKE